MSIIYEWIGFIIIILITHIMIVLEANFFVIFYNLVMNYKTNLWIDYFNYNNLKQADPTKFENGITFARFIEIIKHGEQIDKHYI